MPHTVTSGYPPASHCHLASSPCLTQSLSVKLNKLNKKLKGHRACVALTGHRLSLRLGPAPGLSRPHRASPVTHARPRPRPESPSQGTACHSGSAPPPACVALPGHRLSLSSAPPPACVALPGHLLSLRLGPAPGLRRPHRAPPVTHARPRPRPASPSQGTACHSRSAPPPPQRLTDLCRVRDRIARL